MAEWQDKPPQGGDWTEKPPVEEGTPPAGDTYILQEQGGRRILLEFPPLGDFEGEYILQETGTPQPGNYWQGKDVTPRPWTEKEDL